MKKPNAYTQRQRHRLRADVAQQLDEARIGRQDFMDAAWYSFVIWASKKPEMLAEYAEATGKNFGSGPSPIDRLIDRATGHKPDVQKEAEDFMLWVTEHHWGIDDAPDGIKQLAKEKRT